MMVTGPSVDRARTKISFCEARLPPGSGTLNSGTARSGTTCESAGSVAAPSIDITSCGNPSADSQQCASARAEYPARQCFSGSANSDFQSSGPVVNESMRIVPSRPNVWLESRAEAPRFFESGARSARTRSSLAILHSRPPVPRPTSAVRHRDDTHGISIAAEDECIWKATERNSTVH